MKLIGRSLWALHHATQPDSWRTLCSKFGIFVPVSKRRWITAQKFEFHAWELPDIWESNDIHPSFINEETKSNFIISVAERALNFSLRDLVSNKVVVDVACGPCSVVATMDQPLLKYGVDPFRFPAWVLSRYRSLDFNLVSAPLEDLDLILSKDSDAPVFIMYNALQHFGSPYKALRKLTIIAPHHTVLIIDYLDTPADRAHPQILTRKRILRLIRVLGYQSVLETATGAYLEGLVQSGGNKPVKIGAFIATK